MHSWKFGFETPYPPTDRSIYLEKILVKSICKRKQISCVFSIFFSKSQLARNMLNCIFSYGKYYVILQHPSGNIIGGADILHMIFESKKEETRGCATQNSKIVSIEWYKA